MPTREHLPFAEPQPSQLANLPTEFFHHDRRNIAPREPGARAFRRTRHRSHPPSLWLQRPGDRTTRLDLRARSNGIACAKVYQTPSSSVPTRLLLRASLRRLGISETEPRSQALLVTSRQRSGTDLSNPRIRLTTL